MICGRPPGRPFVFFVPAAPAGFWGAAAPGFLATGRGRRRGFAALERRAAAQPSETARQDKFFFLLLQNSAVSENSGQGFFSCIWHLNTRSSVDKVFFLYLAFVCRCEQEIVLTPARRFSKPDFAARQVILRCVCRLATEKLPEPFSSSLNSCCSKKKTLSAVFSESVSDCLQEKKPCPAANIPHAIAKIPCKYSPYMVKFNI